MAAPKGWRAIKTVWYVVWSMVFIFGVMVSLFVMLGMAGTDNGQFWAGLFALVVFWYAAGNYRRKGLLLMDEAMKEQEHQKGDDDE